MKMYLDYVFLVNFLFDFILLLGISIILKRNTSKLRIILGAIFGGFSFFIIFLQISSTLFFISKIILAFFMLIITFSFKDLKYTFNNLIYLMVLSIIMGGALYLVDIQVNSKHIGMLFFTTKEKNNLLILIIIAFITIISYTIHLKKHKLNGSKLFKTNIYINDKEYRLNGFLDTGCTLSYLGKPCIILNKNIEMPCNKNLYIPFTTISGKGIMKGFKANKIFVDGYGFFENVIIAISNDKFHLEGTDIILNINLLEDNHEKNN